MNFQETNAQALPVITNSRSYLDAKRFGFKFVAARKRHDDRCNKRDEIIEDIGEKPKPIKTILSFICIGIALIFAYIESQNVKATIIGATGMGETAAIIIGFAFAAAGLVAGEMLTSSSSWKVDGFSTKKSPAPKFYIAVAFTLVYLIGQYWLSSRAGIGSSADMMETITTVKWFVLGIAIAEVLFGMAFLATAIKFFTLFIANIRIKLTWKTMYRNSRNCEESWQRYIYECNGRPMQEEVQAIKEARQFYATGGIDTYDNLNYSTLN